MTIKKVIRIFGVKMGIFSRKNVIQKFWSANNFSVPPNSAPGLRHRLQVHVEPAFLTRQRWHKEAAKSASEGQQKARASIHSFIHSGHFYSAPSSPLLLRGAPDYSTD